MKRTLIALGLTVILAATACQTGPGPAGGDKVN